MPFPLSCGGARANKGVQILLCQGGTTMELIKVLHEVILSRERSVFDRAFQAVADPVPTGLVMNFEKFDKGKPSVAEHASIASKRCL